MHFLPDNIDDYVVKHSQSEPQILQELTRENLAKSIKPTNVKWCFSG